MQVPTSTPNISVLLELGIRPIEHEIHIRQLAFLYHIVFLEEEDPVKKVHQQQKNYHQQRKWYNEVMEFQKRYKINNSEKEILEMGRYEWKKIVKGRIMTEITDAMNHQRMTQTKSFQLPPYTKLEIQEIPRGNRIREEAILVSI